jgi:hypothetical protein
MSIHIDAIAHNEETFLEIRKGFQDIIYAPCHPPCLTEWLEKWNTPLRKVLAVSPVTNLWRAPSTHGRAPSGPINLTGDASNPLRTNQSTAAFGATPVAATSGHINLTREVNDMRHGHHGVAKRRGATGGSDQSGAVQGDHIRAVARCAVKWLLGRGGSCHTVGGTAAEAADAPAPCGHLRESPQSPLIPYSPPRATGGEVSRGTAQGAGGETGLSGGGAAGKQRRRSAK